MPKFSQRSLQRLKTCHPDLQKLFEEVIKTYDCTIQEGHRSNERQEQLFDEDKTKLRAGQSKHNKTPSIAVDVAPYPTDWQDHKAFIFFAGYVFATADKLGISIRWGGNWDGDSEFNDQKFNDYPHFELK